jgi:hypothetical protein
MSFLQYSIDLTGPNGLTTTWEYDALGSRILNRCASAHNATACYCTFGFVAKTVIFISGGKRFVSIWLYGFGSMMHSADKPRKQELTAPPQPSTMSGGKLMPTRATQGLSTR